MDSIGIDEFAVRKGHVYKTIVVDLKSGRILHVGQGKAANALAGFWKRVRRKKLDIKYIATDLSASERYGCSPINKQPKKVMLDWVKQAQESKVPQLMKMAVTIMAYRTGILAWYYCPISTGKAEGINNKIKVMKRVAYDFRDERYFQLRLYALHDCRITPNVR